MNLNSLSSCSPAIPNLLSTLYSFCLYVVLGPNKDISPSGDRRLAQSAQMYHYQHQKQQIIQQMDNQNSNDQNGSISDVETDEENEEGDYTVYECPGLAPVIHFFNISFGLILIAQNRRT